jgi:uncharacterized protein (TIGR00299 family) protein
MSVLYCDCFSGIAGDMFLAALIDAGLPLDLLNSHFEKLPITEKIHLSTRRVRKGALDANQLVIQIGEAMDDHAQSHQAAAHSHAHTEGHAHTHDHGHEHNHDHSHEPHDHSHSHAEIEHAHVHSAQPSETHSHHHRGLSDILNIIEHAALTPKAAETARLIFTRLAEVEAKVHGETIESVHFHEVGALDSIIDILGVSIGLDYFQVEQVYSSALPFSSGTVKTDHGLMPVPAPATLGLIESAQMPLRPAPEAGELITPTGAAILAVLATFQRPAMRVKKVGVGAGTKEFEWPNIMRVMIGDQELAATQPMIQVSSNIDDMNPEFFAPVMTHLFEAGAVDVFLTPIQMKKNRPATMLTAIAPVWLEKQLCELILQETTSFGVRVETIHRYEAQRDFVTLDTALGPIRIKQKWVNGEFMGNFPEFEDCKQLAEVHHLTLMQVYQQALQTAAQLQV